MVPTAVSAATLMVVCDVQVVVHLSRNMRIGQMVKTFEQLLAQRYSIKRYLASLGAKVTKHWMATPTMNKERSRIVSLTITIGATGFFMVPLLTARILRAVNNEISNTMSMKVGMMSIRVAIDDSRKKSEF